MSQKSIGVLEIKFNDIPENYANDRKGVCFYVMSVSHDFSRFLIFISEFERKLLNKHSIELNVVLFFCPAGFSPNDNNTFPCILPNPSIVIHFD